MNSANYDGEYCNYCGQQLHGLHNCPQSARGNILDREPHQYFIEQGDINSEPETLSWTPPSDYITPPKGDPMPQTVEAWEHLYGLSEQAMERQRDEISKLKQRINKLQQKGESNE